MNFRIAIPSIARAKTIKEKTLNYLQRTNIDMENVDIFLSDGNELEQYQESCKDYAVNFIVTNQKHVNTQRNFIVKHYNENQWILGIDDDINTMQLKINDKKTTELIDLNAFVNNAIEICTAHKFDLWGVNPVLNPYF